MGTATFSRNAEIRYEDQSWKLLREVVTGTWQIEQMTTGRIQEVTLQQLRNALVAGKLTFQVAKAKEPNKQANEPPKEPRLITPEQLADAKIRRSYVVAALEHPRSRASLNPQIREVWESLGKQPTQLPGFSSVCRWIQAYLGAGRDIKGLVERRHEQGNRSRRIPENLVPFIEDAVDNVYLTRERKSLQDALEAAITAIGKENRLRPKELQLPKPTRRMLSRYLEKLPAFDCYAARYGITAAKRKYRSVLKHVVADRPLERAEIDHTRLDLFVVDEETGAPLGRPWVTACIDVFSRCILGINVGFEPPSHLTVARCLRNAFLPKTTLRTEFPEIKNDWGAHGVMRALGVDNGLEFHSESLEDVCYAFGVDMYFCPRKTPWFKGAIERFLGTLNRGVAHGTPGTTFSNIFEKDDYDPSKHAIVTLETLQKVIRIWIADVYHQKVHRTLGTSPAAMWTASIKPEDIEVPDDPMKLDAVLGRLDVRTLTHKGIELNGLFYNSPELTELRCTKGDKLTVDIRIDDGNIDHIIVFSPDKTQMFRVPTLSMTYAQGISLWQHKVYKRYAAESLPKAAGPEAWLQAKETIAELVDADAGRKRSRRRIAEKRIRTSAPSPAAAVTAVIAPEPIGAESAASDQLDDVELRSPAAGRPRYAPIYEKPHTPVLQEVSDE